MSHNGRIYTQPVASPNFLRYLCRDENGNTNYGLAFIPEELHDDFIWVHKECLNVSSKLFLDVELNSVDGLREKRLNLIRKAENIHATFMFTTDEEDRLYEIVWGL